MFEIEWEETEIYSQIVEIEAERERRAEEAERDAIYYDSIGLCRFA